jgi:hypothetical protein
MTQGSGRQARCSVRSIIEQPALRERVRKTPRLSEGNPVARKII